MRNLFTIHLAVLILLLTGCATNRPYRLQGIEPNPAGEAEQAGAPVEVLSTPTDGVVATLGYVELDDQGDLWSRGQLDAVCETLEDAAAADKLVVLFVHGWNHNAAENSGQLDRFRSMLKNLAEVYGPDGPAEVPRQIHGVYVAWRGRTFESITPRTDFYERMDSAHRTAGVSSSHALFRLLHAANSSDGNPRTQPNQQNLVLVVGHSFGTIVLENSLNQIMAMEIAACQGQPACLTKAMQERIPADLILLVNSAQRSNIPAQLVAIAQADAGRDLRGERPFLVSVTSQADVPVRLFFPLGMRLGRFFRHASLGLVSVGLGGKLREDAYPGLEDQALTSQKEFLTRSAGFNPALHSHSISRVETNQLPHGFACPTDPGPEADAFLPAFRENFIRGISDDDKALYLYAVGKNGGENWKLSPKADAYNQSPYWIFQAPKTLISSHNDIWNHSFVGLTIALLERTRRDREYRKGPRQNSTPEVLRELFSEAAPRP